MSVLNSVSSPISSKFPVAFAKPLALVVTSSLFAVLCSSCAKNESSSTQTTGGAAAGAAAVSCANPISMDLEATDQKVEFDAVIDGTAGQYVLVGTKSFSRTDSASKVDFLSGAGDAAPGVIDDTQKVTRTDLTKVVCHTVKPGVLDEGSKRTERPDGYTVDSWKRSATHTMNGTIDVPATISSLDGSVTVYRTDSFRVKDGVVESKSEFYPRREQMSSHANDPVPPGMTVLVVKKANRDIVLKLKYSKRENETDMTLWLEATYRKQ